MVFLGLLFWCENSIASSFWGDFHASSKYQWYTFIKKSYKETQSDTLYTGNCSTVAFLYVLCNDHMKMRCEMKSFGEIKWNDVGIQTHTHIRATRTERTLRSIQKHLLYECFCRITRHYLSQHHHDEGYTLSPAQYYYFPSNNTTTLPNQKYKNKCGNSFKYNNNNNNKYIHVSCVYPTDRAQWVFWRI